MYRTITFEAKSVFLDDALPAQAYLKLLLQAIGGQASSANPSATAKVAARCMCGMLSALHHFNYSSDLLQAVVPLMTHKDEQLRQLSCEAVRQVLMHDEEGRVAVEAVQLVGSSAKLQSPCLQYVCQIEAVLLPSACSSSPFSACWLLISLFFCCQQQSVSVFGQQVSPSNL